MKLPNVKRIPGLLRGAAVDAAGLAAKVSTGVAKAAGSTVRSAMKRRVETRPEALPPQDPLPPPPQALLPDPARRHTAARPQGLSRRGWWEVVLKVYDEIFRDRLMLIAAGVAFYVMLSLFPAMTVLIWLYGLVADPAQAVALLTDLAFLLPAGSLELLQQQAKAIAATGRSNPNTLILVSILIAVWSSNAGMKSIFDAMNIIYNEDEKRGIIAYNVQSALFTLGALAIFLATLAVLVFVPILLSYVNLQGTFAKVFIYLRWPLLYGITVVFLILLNRYGPSRESHRARWSIWGSALGAALWIAVSLAFSWYVEHLGNLSATYGSIAAIAGLMLWLWLSALAILIGFELNHELELRTQRWEDEERHRLELKEWERRRAAHVSEPPMPSKPRGLSRFWRR